MSQAFRELIQKVGSGTHTSEPLSRAEAAMATRMILLQEATPIQIGAFLIAHRIKRPTGTELAGMLDTYDVLGPKVAAISSDKPVAVFSVPYDGRSRTAPLLPLTALVLAAAGCPVLIHGGDRIATKYGVPLIELWQSLGVDWSGLSLEQIRHILSEINLGFLYTSDHFPTLQPLMEARGQIGKRPPFATLELFWCPYAGKARLISGYVHPPTETMLQEAFALRGTTGYTTIKGLEGSCDLPRDRTAIIGKFPGEPELERILLNARDQELSGSEVPYRSREDWTESAQQVLAGKETSELYPAIVWNSGFYLWHLDCTPTLTEGIELAKILMKDKSVLFKLKSLQQVIQDLPACVS